MLPDHLLRIIHGNCEEVLPTFPTGAVKLVFADPPYNIGKVYAGYWDELPKHKYLEWAEAWIKECARILAHNGSMFVLISDEHAAEYKLILDKYLKFRNWIIWHYSFGQSLKHKFSRSHAHLLYYVKSEDNIYFNADAIRVPSMRAKIYSDARARTGGKVPDDTFFFEIQRAKELFNTPEKLKALEIVTQTLEEANLGYIEANTKNDALIEVPRVCGTHKERIKNHPCQLPLDLLRIIINSTTERGDIVLDPHGGTGTTLEACLRFFRRFCIIEQSKVYIDIMYKRLQRVREELKLNTENKTEWDYFFSQFDVIEKSR